MADTELAVNVRQMPLDGLDRDAQQVGDLAVAHPVAGQRRDPTLGLGEGVAAASASPGLCPSRSSSSAAHAAQGSRNATRLTASLAGSPPRSARRGRGRSRRPARQAGEVGVDLGSQARRRLPLEQRAGRRSTAIRSVESATADRPRRASASPYGDPAARATATWWTASVRALAISPVRTRARASGRATGRPRGRPCRPSPRRRPRTAGSRCRRRQRREHVAEGLVGDATQPSGPVLPRHDVVGGAARLATLTPREPALHQGRDDQRERCLPGGQRARRGRQSVQRGRHLTRSSVGTPRVRRWNSGPPASRRRQEVWCVHGEQDRDHGALGGGVPGNFVPVCGFPGPPV